MIDKIINALNDPNDFIAIQDFNFRKDKENELLLFFKPEVFFPKIEFTKKILEMTFQKLIAHEVEISGMAMLYGNFIKEHEIMDRHYGFINKMSKNASSIVTDEEKEKIKTLLEISNINDYRISGGHEFLNEFPTQNLESLGKIWFSKPSIKIRSGFYAMTCEVENRKIILINGFHPAQLAHLQNPDHKIVVVLIHSNTDWKILKNDLAGNTFPEKADQKTIRGEIFANKDKYGAANVSANFNFVHLSAGAFEALFEINNFLSVFPTLNFDLTQTNIGKILLKKGLNKTAIINSIHNPVKKIDSKIIDLFSYTEEQNTLTAIDNFSRLFQ